MWGIGCVVWTVLLIQVAFAKNETVVIKDTSDSTLSAPGESPDNLKAVIHEEDIPPEDAQVNPGVNNQGNNNKAKRNDDTCVHINTADVDVLVTLQGVGPVLAERIVTFRKKNGNFTKAADLVKVKGIGEGKLQKIKDYICF